MSKVKRTEIITLRVTKELKNDLLKLSQMEDRTLSTVASRILEYGYSSYYEARKRFKDPPEVILSAYRDGTLQPK